MFWTWFLLKGFQDRHFRLSASFWSPFLIFVVHFNTISFRPRKCRHMDVFPNSASKNVIWMYFWIPPLKIQLYCFPPVFFNFLRNNNKRLVFLDPVSWVSQTSIVNSPMETNLPDSTYVCLGPLLSEFLEIIFAAPKLINDKLYYSGESLNAKR